MFFILREKTAMLNFETPTFNETIILTMLKPYLKYLENLKRINYALKYDMFTILI